MENNHFDKLFQDKLGNLEDSDKAGSWELLQHRMAADPELSTPADTSDPIDDIVKSKLEDTSASYEPGLWAMMEDKINADVDLNPQLDDVAFDGIAYENLNDLETPYNPSHWELMAKRIQEEFSLQHRLYKYKVAEISLMLFAIFTLLQFLPINKIVIAKNDKAANKTEIAAETQPAFAPAPLDIGRNETSSNTETVNQVITTPIGTIDIPNLLATAKTNESKNTTNTETLTELPDFSKLSNIGTSANAPVENTLPLATTLSVINDQQAANQNTETLTAVDNELPTITELLHINSSEMDLLNYDDSDNLPRCTHCKRKKPKFIRTGMFIATDLNYTMTPYNEKFEQTSYSTLSSGYTGGLSLSVQQGRWEIGSALHYSSIKYAPKQNVEYTGSLREGLTAEVVLRSAQLNILSIPLNINYTYTYVGKWHLYVVGGGSINMAVVNHFDTKKFSIGASRDGNGDPRVVDPPHSEPTPSYSGVFEGGSIQDNLYITVNLGLGAERYLTPRWSVFIQPVYQHSLFATGLGPNSDRFNTFSIFAGAKATLK